MTCTVKNRVTKVTPGLVIHDPDCHVRLLALSDKPDPNADLAYDWREGKKLERYPAIVYLGGEPELKIDSKSSSGSYPLLSSHYHVAENQLLEDPA